MKYYTKGLNKNGIVIETLHNVDEMTTNQLEKSLEEREKMHLHHKFKNTLDWRKDAGILAKLQKQIDYIKSKLTTKEV
jgi:hypothetical protein